ncbi:hypothetical protein E1B28_000723 [Marasmius oreades]|uniref:Uncharacterized protein n=1 Tax=Marasmius oreades TaxID=181124 RepID=A0A9P8AES7_9AGAR|nr:uncharacterized protein E1B28_000723 [Marasmius oreades]KAG7098818.1 hypothetical protein E1B28_000723 [Marasmius oreades]
MFVGSVLLLLALGILQYVRNLPTEPRLTWSIPKLEHVAMHIIPTSSRYKMGAEAWKHMLPSGGHVIRIEEADGMITTHTVAMFHQLRCLELLQQAYVDEGSHRTSELVQHCMNYLRQTVLCQMDMRTEIQGSTFTHSGYDQMCNDWEVIYTEAEKNWEAYTQQKQ